MTRSINDDHDNYEQDYEDNGTNHSIESTPALFRINFYLSRLLTYLKGGLLNISGFLLHVDNLVLVDDDLLEVLLHLALNLVNLRKGAAQLIATRFGPICDGL